MRFALFIGLVGIALVGCSSADDFIDSLFGIKHNAVILARGGIDISSTPTILTPVTHAQVVGKSSDVCVVLAGGIAAKDSEKEVQRILNGAKLRAEITMSDGSRHEFNCPGSGWALNGRIVPENEVAACLRQSCASQLLTIGATVSSVAISSTAPVHALGVYWDSTSAYDRASN